MIHFIHSVAHSKNSTIGLRIQCVLCRFFLIEWRTFISNSSSGFITSPYYPALYLNNMKRSWMIEAPNDHNLALYFPYLNLEDHKNCKRDSVILKDRSRTFLSFCGYKLASPTLLSHDSKVSVIFQSDKMNVGTGFKLRYQAISGKSVTDNLINACKNLLFVAQ